jgi:hypothetical protein
MMIVTFRESLDRVVPAGFRQKQVNDAVRSGLILAADYLIEVNLRQRKFATGNRSRYGFAARNRSYENRKRAAEFVRDPDTGLKVRPAKPAVDLVYTGRLRDFIHARGPEVYRKIPTATSNRVRIRIPIQVPGRAKGGAYMRAEQYEELSRWTQQEYVEMRRILIAEVARILKLGDASEENLWRRAG